MACLVYHNLGITPDFLTISPRSFYTQMRRLREKCCTTLVASDVLNVPAVPHPVMITFDDAYESFYEVALPVLASYSLRPTLFVISGLLGKLSPWFGLRCMTPGQLREVAASGLVEIGSHTRNHPDLRTLPPDRLLEELKNGRDDLEQLLGTRIRAFSYPFGAYNEAVTAAARQVFDCAFTARQGLNTAETDLYLLRRTTVDRYEGPFGLHAMLRSGYHPVRWRRLLLKYRMKWQAAHI
jgi:peptidoglycan/xylan/chitin deacetylase (PgdA/CDA1 family)